MRWRLIVLTALAAIMWLAGGCATSEQWRDWRSHSSHFASGQHMGFSLRNTEGSSPRVRRADVEASRIENWWGKPITVSPDQIFQN
jgi:hypothetical protein